jgi:rRNA maturation endonuclease Nob1
LKIEGATSITLTEKLQEQKRFFCESCRHEVFLHAEFCDECGGEIEWPEKIQEIRNAWTKKK